MLRFITATLVLAASTQALVAARVTAQHQVHSTHSEALNETQSVTATRELIDFSSTPKPCVKPTNAVSYWKNELDTSKEYPDCISVDGSDKIKYVGNWVMLNSYREEGTEGTHWRYVKDSQDTKGCLDPNWDYYHKDGERLVTRIETQTTTLNRNALWCPLKVYRHGGKEGKQWGKCQC